MNEAINGKASDHRLGDFYFASTLSFFRPAVEKGIDSSCADGRCQDPSFLQAFWLFTTAESLSGTGKHRGFGGLGQLLSCIFAPLSSIARA